jgi:flavin-dependent dehydrogenase
MTLSRTARDPDRKQEPSLRLRSGSRVAVIGGGPAGSFFGYFILTMAGQAGIDIGVDIYEPRDFSKPGVCGCNKCGGIIYESLVQSLATDGILLPPSVVQQGIDCYMFHTDEESVRFKTFRDEKRVASVRRGAGPCGAARSLLASFDGFLLRLAEKQGARIVRERATEAAMIDGIPRVTTQAGRSEDYDLLVGALGVNSPDLTLFADCGTGYAPPSTSRTYITEILLGAEAVEKCLGDTMHFLLLDIPRLKFAAIIPKGDYATVCLLGRGDIGPELVASFFGHPQVKRCFPPGWQHDTARCRCFPAITLGRAKGAYGDRFVMVGDCCVSRLYKDGIGNAYRTAKAAAQTAILEGISKGDFDRHYRPSCDAIAFDNRFGRIVYTITSVIKRLPFLRRGLVRMVRSEQDGFAAPRGSNILWDTFTGNASFRAIVTRAIHPAFLARLACATAAGWLSATKPIPEEDRR